jgi:hypothetical protein
MDRASGFEPEGCRFEPCRGRHARIHACSSVTAGPIRSVLIADAPGAFRNPYGQGRERPAATGRAGPDRTSSLTRACEAQWPAVVGGFGARGAGTATGLMGPSYISRSEAAASQGGQAFARELSKENPPAGKDRVLQERGSLTIWGTRAWFNAGLGAHGEPGGQSPQLNGCK